MKKTRKKRKSNGAFRALVFVFVLFCVWLFSTFTLTIERTEFSSGKIKDEITIVHITDLHGADFGLNNSAITKRVDKIDPDFVVVTGDMYTRDDKNGMRVAEKLLTNLAKKHTVYYVNGEHDNDEDFIAGVRNGGVKVLNYLYEDIRVGETDIRIYGINNVYYSPTFDLNNEFTLDKSKYNILLAHICNKEKFASFGMDLCLCGDTHGGQIRLPFAGGVYGTTGWFPEIRDKKAFVKGAYEYENTSFFISSGLGNYPLPLRFMNRPEVAVITLIP